MPRGDYQHLKADPEDGTVHIANLLLEALSIASLNGVQKGLILFVWRRTYGWTSGKQKFKTDRIKLGEFAEAVHTQKPYVSKMLKALIKANIIFAEPDEQDSRCKRYGMNTEVSTWDKSAIDLEALAKATKNQVFVHSSRQQKSLYKSTTVTQTYNSYTNEQPLHKRITKRLHKCIRKRLYKRITFMAPKVASLLASRVTERKRKEKEKQKPIDRYALELELIKVGHEVYRETDGISRNLAYDLTDMSMRNSLDIQVAAEAIRVAKEIQKDSRFAKHKLKTWIENGVTSVEMAKDFEERTFGARLQVSATVSARDGPAPVPGLPPEVKEWDKFANRGPT